MSAKDKMPWIAHKGREYNDSFLIIRELNSAFGVDMNAHLSAREKAQALAFDRMLCESQPYWALVRLRWVDSHYDLVARNVLGITAWPLSWLVPRVIIGPRIKSALWGQGTGRHSRFEAETLTIEQIAAVAAQLGDRKFLFGDSPCEADLSAYAILSQWLWQPFPSRVRDALLARWGVYHEMGAERLTEYAERVRELAFPDFEELQRDPKESSRTTSFEYDKKKGLVSKLL